ncbi:MAG: helix-turn-helix domain-containing protein [Treponema sp.]|nr:helix-turn-helix domain-containing protein [Treponema sp.]
MTEIEIRQIFSANIKKYRHKKRLSQMDLAKGACISSNFVNDMENGKKWASPGTMVKIAEVLGIEAYELLKPEGLYPDNLNSIVNKYTDDIHFALDKIRKDFLKT